MDITSAPPAISRQNATPAAPANSDGKPSVTSDFDTFLKMMTAQIRNQDPLNPMKSEEFAVQLATFSNVEQSVRTNELLEKMISSGGSDDFTAVSNWLGRDVRAPMDVRYTGQPIRLQIEPPVAGSRHELVVHDALGREVDRRQVDEAGGPAQWSGTRTDGQAAVMGTYKFTVESFEDGTLVASETPAAYAKVAEVRSSPTGPMLAFDGGMEIAASSVTAVRDGS
ncbi:flagellar hook capping FlgD N-terminal domain-containing protein [Palleronia sp. LCG004]|uniref:flagellar hook capping FlgD N-terminal domain-containing protein n=1 Tax=Palleronia sp. LCG004 TaxID=3079304 RepID=UPI0029423986|nr:flagellar hook capping FlgD N-terminal domain-containing protein [Palleronia sp. LCG004]WOI56207.1 flagellar hook capping FlgD N-terminal domain-containing protein [Palleronia sp. LCG004]